MTSREDPVTSSETFEKIHNAFQLEEYLSQGALFAADSQAHMFLTATVMSRVEPYASDTYYVRFVTLKAGTVADPLQPIHLLLILSWIPINVIILGIRLIQLMSYWFTHKPRLVQVSSQETLWIGLTDLRFEAPLGYSPIQMSSIREININQNGLDLETDARYYRIDTPDKEWLFVAITHLADHLERRNGLRIPKDFFTIYPQWSDSARQSMMTKNGPSTWSN